mmetsp:Transcript_6492/g.7436  ORF Transcript_6492/g.7436 Transcript_6492/m.7436 type:complete len:441 (+) Transcript_6492:99-1421(+)
MSTWHRYQKYVRKQHWYEGNNGTKKTKNEMDMKYDEESITSIIAKRTGKNKPVIKKITLVRRTKKHMPKAARDFFLTQGSSNRDFFEKRSSSPLLLLRSKHQKKKDIDGTFSSTSTNNTASSWEEENYENQRRLLEKAKVLDQKGISSFRQGKYQEALKHYQEALILKRQTLELNVDGNDCDDDVVVLKNQENDDDDATPVSVKDQLLASVATSINNIGFLRQRMNSATVEEIMSVYKESLQIKKRILGENHLSVGTTLNNIGSVYFSNELFHEAMNAYQQALEIMVLKLGNFHLDVATVYSNIGDVYFATDRLEEAEISYDLALKTRWSVIGDNKDRKNDPRVVRLLERISTIEMVRMTQESDAGRRKVRADSDEVYFPHVDSYKKLNNDMRQSVKFMEQMERQLQLEMFRDKIQLVCEMRELKQQQHNNNNNNNSEEV